MKYIVKFHLSNDAVITTQGTSEDTVKFIKKTFDSRWSKSIFLNDTTGRTNNFQIDISKIIYIEYETQG